MIIIRRHYEESGPIHAENKKTLTCKEICELNYRNNPVAAKVVKGNAEMVGSEEYLSLSI